jgi:GTP-binding protein HflX
LLLHVVDAADPAFREQIAVTTTVLSEIGATDHPRLLVLNKVDKLTDEEKEALTSEFPDGVQMSAREPQRVAALHARIVQFFHDSFEEDVFVIPYDAQKFVAELHQTTTVIEERWEPEGAHVRVRGPLAIIARFRRDIRGEVPEILED